MQSQLSVPVRSLKSGQGKGELRFSAYVLHDLAEAHTRGRRGRLDTVPRSWYDSVAFRRSSTYLSQASIRSSAPISGHGVVRLRVWPVGFLHRVLHLEAQRTAHRWNGSDPALPGDGGTRAVSSALDSGRSCAIPDDSPTGRFAA
jgi:hypothetical protein